MELVDEQWGVLTLVPTFARDSTVFQFEIAIIDHGNDWR
jgi:hypothetical protein